MKKIFLWLIILFCSELSFGQNNSQCDPPSCGDPLNDPTNLLSKRSIYFDQSFYIREEFKPVIEAHAKYLISRKDRKIIIQGNSEDRGMSEISLALSLKCAESVRRALIQLGVPESQMEAISVGKEKARRLGRNEAALAENRRVDIIY